MTVLSNVFSMRPRHVVAVAYLACAAAWGLGGRSAR